MSSSEDILRELCAQMLDDVGVHAAPHLTRLVGGANNRAYRVDAGTESFCLKAYYHHANDPRDRMHAEVSFSTHAWSLGIRAIPEPLAARPEHHVALYRFVPGSRLRPGEVGAAHIAAALDFLSKLNTEARFNARLPHGAEACFSIPEHLACAETRVRRLLTIPADTPICSDAARFAASQLVPAWERVVSDVRRQAGTGLQELSSRERCVSPSDFGFHNAILRPTGTLCFHDFEYAGWDDPAKLVGDFFCQPAVPVPDAFFDRVADRVARLFARPAACRRRMELLLPVHRLKWCCILLNEFLPDELRRRRFAAVDHDLPARRAAQLDKARRAFEEI